MSYFPGSGSVRIFVSVVVAATVLSACSILNGNRSGQVSVYQLELTQDFETSIRKPAQPLCNILLISTPSSAPGLTSARMAYVTDASHLEYYANNRWVDTPARMFSPLLVRAMDSSGLFRYVVVSPAPVDANLRLETEVVSLRQVFDGTGSAVEVELRVNLFDLSGRDVVFSKRLKVAEPAKTNDAAGGALAANRAVSRLMSDLVGVVADEFSDRPCS